MNTNSKLISKIPVLFSSEQIQEEIKKIANKLSTDFKKKRTVAIGVMKGSFRFYCDLLLSMDMDIICDFYYTSSYGLNDKPSTEVRVLLDAQVDLSDKHVILIEDVVDRGITLDVIMTHLKSRNPLSITIVALVIKPDQFQKNIQIDHHCFKLKGDPFIVGFGLDYHEKYRNLSYIGKIEKLSN